MGIYSNLENALLLHSIVPSPAVEEHEIGSMHLLKLC